MFRRFASRCLLGMGVVLAGAVATQADDFRIESRVYEGKESKLVSENTTLFRAGIVYDFITEKSVAVFDKPRNRFLLLDPSRRVKTEIKLTELQDFCDRLQHLAKRDGNAFLRFVADPKFDITLNDSTGDLTFASQQITYRVTPLKGVSPEAVQQYREFTDWYSRLNAMTNPGGTPPFPRLAVNEELARRGVVAEKVNLNLTHSGRRNVALRSEHRFTWRVLASDNDRITKAEGQIAAFKPLSFAEFQEKEEQAKK